MNMYFKHPKSRITLETQTKCPLLLPSLKKGLRQTILFSFKIFNSLEKTTANTHPINPTAGAHDAHGTDTLPSL